MNSLAGRSGRIEPDGRSVTAFLLFERNARRQFQLEADHVIIDPGWGRYLQHANIVEGPLPRVELGVRPDGGKAGCSDRVLVCGRCGIYGVANRGNLSAHQLALIHAGPDHVKHLFLGLALGIDPTLDDLNPVEVGPLRVLEGRDDEAWDAARAANEIQGASILAKAGKPLFFLALFGFKTVEALLDWANQ